MIVNEIKNYIELGNLIVKIEAQVSMIEEGDLNFQISCLEKFPFFDVSEPNDLRKEALMDYFSMQVSAFYSSCKFIYEAIDPIMLDAINACIERLNKVLLTQKVTDQRIPLAKPLYDLYNRAYGKLLKEGRRDYAANLEQLRYRIFMGWQIIR